MHHCGPLEFHKTKDAAGEQAAGSIEIPTQVQDKRCVDLLLNASDDNTKVEGRPDFVKLQQAFDKGYLDFTRSQQALNDLITENSQAEVQKRVAAPRRGNHNEVHEQWKAGTYGDISLPEAFKKYLRTR